jgi:hypothetical protein
MAATSITDSALTTPGDCVTVGTGGLLGEVACGGSISPQSKVVSITSAAGSGACTTGVASGFTGLTETTPLTASLVGTSYFYNVTTVYTGATSVELFLCNGITSGQYAAAATAVTVVVSAI